MTESLYNGYRRVDFIFEGRETLIVFPKEENKTNKWMLKTEYFDAFPELEIAISGVAIIWSISKTSTAGASMRINASSVILPIIWCASTGSPAVASASA